MKLELKREVQLLFNSKPVVLKKSELEKIKKYVKKYIKNYQYKHLFDFVKYDLVEDMIASNEDQLNLEEFYLSEYNTCVVFIQFDLYWLFFYFWLNKITNKGDNNDK